MLAGLARSWEGHAMVQSLMSSHPVANPSGLALQQDSREESRSIAIQDKVREQWALPQGNGAEL